MLQLTPFKINVEQGGTLERKSKSPITTFNRKSKNFLRNGIKNAEAITTATPPSPAGHTYTNRAIFS